MLNSKVKKWGIIVILLIVVVVVINFILSSAASKIVQNQVEKINNNGRVHLKIDKVKLDLVGSKIVLQDITLEPSDTFFKKFKQGKTYKSTVGKLRLDELKIQGIHVFELLFSDEIVTKKISVDGLDLEVFKSDTFLEDKNSTKKKIAFDSIFISGVNKVDLGSIEVDKFRFKLINVQSGDTLFKYREDEFIVKGVGLKGFDSLPNYFKFHKDDLKVTFKEQKIELNSGYNIHLGNINYEFKEKRISISNFQLKPKQSREELASSYKYNTEVFTVDTKKLDIYGIYIDSIVRTGAIDIDSLVVDQLNINIYKDQTHPFNLNKRPLFINQKLKAIKQPLNIDKVVVNNSILFYEEKHPDTKDLMAITIADLNAKINDITSLKDSASLEKELTINLKGKLNNKATLNLDISMPYNSYANSYSFSGQVGSAKFSDFNSAIYPALGAKIKEGELESVRFNVYGNPQGTKGNMTMLYHGVKADFFKSKEKNKGEKNKAISWITNTVVAEQNPTPKGKVKVALIEFERIPHKGFGNLVWKSFMSGMMNTMIPFGKQVKESEVLKEKRKDQHKQARKDKRLHKKE